MLTEEIPQEWLACGGLLQEALVDDVADVRGGEVNAKRGGEAVLQLREGIRSRFFLELLLAGREEPDASLQPLSEVRDEGLELEHPVIVVVNVLADLVDDEEESLSRGPSVEHRRDVAGHLFDGGPRGGPVAGVTVEPGSSVRDNGRGRGR